MVFIYYVVFIIIQQLTSCLLKACHDMVSTEWNNTISCVFQLPKFELNLAVGLKTKDVVSLTETQTQTKATLS